MLPVPTSHIRALQSHDAESRRSPSGLNWTDFTTPRCTSGGVRGLPVCASQIRAVLSADPVATRVPSRLNCALSTVPSCLSGSVICIPVRVSHSRASWSAAVVTTRVPSGLNCADVITSCFKKSVTGFPLGTSQILAARSDTVSTRVPSGLNWANQTFSSCFSGGLSASPLAASQTVAVPSCEPVTIIFPSLLNCAEKIGSWCLSCNGRSKSRYVSKVVRRPRAASLSGFSTRLRANCANPSGILFSPMARRACK